MMSMMQLICNGVRLDLKQGQTLSFKKSNILFAFDKAECERTVQFDLPATPNNEYVLALAKLPALSGDGMRRRFSAQLVQGTLVRDGYLYVDSYSKGSYKAIFVTGELVGLQAIRDAGKLGELLNLSDITQWAAEMVVPADWQYDMKWRSYKYKRKDASVLPFPSMGVAHLLEDTCSAIGISTPAIEPLASKLRIIPSELSGLQEVDVTITRTRENGTWKEVTSTASFDVVASTSISSDNDAAVSALFSTQNKEVSYRRHWEDYDFSTGQPVLRTETYKAKVTHLVTRQTITLVFPADFPSDLYIGYFSLGSYVAGAVTFYGDRSFSKDWNGYQNVITRLGEELAGRSIELPSGSLFTIIQESDLQDFTQYTEDTTTIETWEQGWKAVQSDLTVDLSASGSVAEGDYVRLQDNLPDITLIDLLRIVAAAEGRVLYYTDADGLSFEELDFSTWDILIADGMLVSVEKVQRRFGDYARFNYVECKSADDVLPSERVQAVYTIENDNLEEQSTLQELPFSDGGREGMCNSREILYIREPADTLADAYEAGEWLNRVLLLKNAGLQSLCTKSTALDAAFAMSLERFMQVTPKTLLQVGGVRYVWTEAQWSNGNAKFNLSAIP